MVSCVFCDIASGVKPALKVYEDGASLAFFDAFPKTRGHIQLIPKTHYRWIYDVPRMDELFATAQKIIHAIIPVLGCDHVTLACYGAQVAHAHIWILPQYSGKNEIIGEYQKSQNVTEDVHVLAQKIQKKLLGGGV
jgi:histidine triad (HIT) family protein